MKRNSKISTIASLWNKALQHCRPTSQPKRKRLVWVGWWLVYWWAVLNSLGNSLGLPLVDGGSWTRLVLGDGGGWAGLVLGDVDLLVLGGGLVDGLGNVFGGGDGLGLVDWVWDLLGGGDSGGDWVWLVDGGGLPLWNILGLGLGDIDLLGLSLGLSLPFVDSGGVAISRGRGVCGESRLGEDSSTEDESSELHFESEGSLSGKRVYWANLVLDIRRTSECLGTR